MSLHLLHVSLDPRAFNGWAGSCGLAPSNRPFDAGFALHHLLARTFGAGQFQPFRLFAPRRGPHALYGYARMDADGLREVAAEVATPECIAALNLPDLRSKLMPARFETGRRLGFEARVRPTRRVGADRSDPQRRDGRPVRAGAEVDAFRLEAITRFPQGFAGDGEADMRAAGRTRAAVYVDWLAARLGEAAELGPTRLESFSRVRVMRKGGARQEGPDAVLRGDLTVADPDAFAARLARGVGRHRAYGYGMLLLRPAGQPVDQGAPRR